jgi:hypothetical protein
MLYPSLLAPKEVCHAYGVESGLHQERSFISIFMDRPFRNSALRGIG